jgi:hypothetical protein
MSTNDLFKNLPADVQREVCALLDRKNIKKLAPKFYDNPEDVYWKMKSLSLTNEVKPEGMSHRDFYESFFYERPLSEGVWNDYFIKMIKDKIFLERHVNMQDYNGSTALMYAVENSYCVKKLLNAGADTNIINEDDETALTLAVKKNKEYIIGLLLSAGADVNLQIPNGTPALVIASIHGSLYTLELLLKFGADVNIEDGGGYTALMNAVEVSKIGYIKLLLSYGANLQNSEGKSVLSMARRPSIKKLLENS